MSLNLHFLDENSTIPTNDHLADFDWILSPFLANATNQSHVDF